MDSGGRKLVLIVIILLVLIGIPVTVDWVLQDSFPDRASVTFLHENGSSVQTIEVEVVASPSEMYTGLGNHESLDSNVGMLFVHDQEDRYTYTMRGMSFPIDIIFIDERSVITTIHHAYPGNSTVYSGQAKNVVEVNLHWTTDHNIAPGDKIRINWDG